MPPVLPNLPTSQSVFSGVTLQVRRARGAVWTKDVLDLRECCLALPRT